MSFATMHFRYDKSNNSSYLIQMKTALDRISKMLLSTNFNYLVKIVTQKYF